MHAELLDRVLAIASVLDCNKVYKSGGTLVSRLWQLFLICGVVNCSLSVWFPSPCNATTQRVVVGHMPCHVYGGKSCEGGDCQCLSRSQVAYSCCMLQLPWAVSVGVCGAGGRSQVWPRCQEGMGRQGLQVSQPLRI
jgi:hypothetical protein